MGSDRAAVRLAQESFGSAWVQGHRCRIEGVRFDFMLGASLALDSKERKSKTGLK